MRHYVYASLHPWSTFVPLYANEFHSRFGVVTHRLRFGGLKSSGLFRRGLQNQLNKALGRLPRFTLTLVGPRFLSLHPHAPIRFALGEGHTDEGNEALPENQAMRGR